MTEVSCALNFEFVLADFVLVTARYYHRLLRLIVCHFWYIKVIAVMSLCKIRTKIHEMTVVSISESRCDEKNMASDLKSAPNTSQNRLKKPKIRAIIFFCCSL